MGGTSTLQSHASIVLAVVNSNSACDVRKWLAPGRMLHVAFGQAKPVHTNAGFAGTLKYSVCIYRYGCMYVFTLY